MLEACTSRACIQRLTLYEGGDKDAQPLLTAQKQIIRTTAQIWNTAPLLYSVLRLAEVPHSRTSDLSRNFLAAFWQTAVMRMCRLV